MSNYTYVITVVNNIQNGHVIIYMKCKPRDLYAGNIKGPPRAPQSLCFANNFRCPIMTLSEIDNILLLSVRSASFLQVFTCYIHSLDDRNLGIISSEVLLQPMLHSSK